MVLRAALISFKVVIASVIITLIISLIAVSIIGKSKKGLARLIEIMMIMPMFIPPSAIGYFILIFLGKKGIIGSFLYEKFNISIIFTVGAAIIAAVVVTVPIMYQNIKSAVLSVNEDIINAARVCGANKFIIFTKIILPLSKRGIFNGILLSFARAFGEFGATILVAGNIPGKTQTLPMAMYYAIEGNNDTTAMQILLLVFIVAIILMCIYNFLTLKSNDDFI